MRVAEVGCAACDYGVALVFCERHAVVVAVGEALRLVLASRCVHSHYGILTESGSIVVVYHSRTREYSAPCVRLNRRTLKLPVHEVGRRRVAPCHVLPLRSVRVVLEVEMPYAVLVEHAVWVVHPSVSRSVVVDGAILLAVGEVERVGVLHVLPAGEARDAAIVAVGAVHVDVERDIAVLLILVEEERHIIVDVVRSQAYVERLHLIVAVYDLHVAHLSLLLHRQEQVFLRFVNTIDAVVATEKMGLLRRGCHCKSYEKRRCRCAAEERFVHFYIGF